MKRWHPVTTGHAIGSSAGGMEITAGAPPVRPGALLGQAVPRHLVLGDHLRGFGGIHGRLALALMTSAMHRQARDGQHGHAGLHPEHSSSYSHWLTQAVNLGDTQRFQVLPPQDGRSQ